MVKIISITNQKGGIHKVALEESCTIADILLRVEYSPLSSAMVTQGIFRQNAMYVELLGIKLNYQKR